jgi:hypothetical protein
LLHDAAIALMTCQETVGLPRRTHSTGWCDRELLEFKQLYHLECTFLTVQDEVAQYEYPRLLIKLTKFLPPEELGHHEGLDNVDQ